MGDRRRDAEGAAAVELALVLPLLVLLLGGIIDFGFAFNTQISLTHAAREGVRVEAIGNGDSVQAARDAFMAMGASAGTVTVPQVCDGPGGQAQVVITATSPLFFSGLLPMVGSSMTMQGEAVMRCGG